MMVIVNIIAMVLAAIMLFLMMLRTRCHDSVGWWLFRILTCYALVCFVYLAYDTSLIGTHLPTRYIFIRFGCVALVLAMALSWRLILKQHNTLPRNNFNSQLTKIFNKGD